MALLLKKSTLYYRESTSDPWTPFVMSADANFMAFADEYSASATYAVGEYCRYDGDFWRCTTTISTAEAWNSAHWQKTTIGAEFQRYLPLTAGAGKPLTGALVLKSSNNPLVVQDNTTADISATPSSAQYWSVFHRDKNTENAAYWQTAFQTSGIMQTTIAARRKVNGSNADNALYLKVASDGTKSVDVTSPAAWRSALGLGTSGAFPITIAQGGSGVTATASDATISNILTVNSGITVHSAAVVYWGKIARLTIDWSYNNAISVAANGMTNIAIATLKSPYKMAGGGGLTGGYMTVSSAVEASGYHVYSGGEIYLKWVSPTGAARTIAANTHLMVSGTYIMA